MIRLPKNIQLPAELAAVQGHPVRHRHMTAAVALLRRDEPLRILELGSWAGCSMLTWAEAARHWGMAAEIHCVDAWERYFGAGDVGGHYDVMTTRCRDAEKVFTRNAEAVGGFNCVIHKHKARTLPMLALWMTKGMTFDLAYVDADHAWPNVATDIALTMHLVADGGILCGDDLERQGFSPHAHAHRRRDFVEHYHPGVTLAVDLLLGPVSCHDGFWLMRRRGDSWERIDDLGGGFMPAHLGGAPC